MARLLPKLTGGGSLCATSASPLPAIQNIGRISLSDVTLIENPLEYIIHNHIYFGNGQPATIATGGGDGGGRAAAGLSPVELDRLARQHRQDNQTPSSRSEIAARHDSAGPAQNGELQAH